MITVMITVVMMLIGHGSSSMGSGYAGHTAAPRAMRDDEPGTRPRGNAMTRVAVTSGLFAAMPEMAAKIREQFPDAKIVEGRPPMAEDDVIEFVRGHDIVVAGIEPYTKRVLDNLPDLKVIACCSAGVDHLDPQLLHERGIRMGWIPGVNKYAVSEMALK